MRLKELDYLELPASADMHVHLRQDAMMELVVPQIRQGGVDTVFVMPNLQPPITTVTPQAVEYRDRLQLIEPEKHSSITPEVITEAAAAGIAGVKVYPQGVTTNSSSGVTSYAEFFSVFAAMEKHDLVLNLHGEVPSDPESDINALNAEEAFLPTLIDIHQRFPTLRIVLEHCTTAAALTAVRACGPSVGATISAHHLFLTEANSCDPFAFCKPVAKTPSDRDALIRAVCSGDPKFFFGSDSAPHTVIAKRGGLEGKGKTPPGIFTQSFATQYVILALEEAIERGVIQDEDVTQKRLEQFLGGFGRRFYKLPDAAKCNRIVLERKGKRIPESIKSEDGSIEVALFKGGDEVLSLSWKAK